MCCVPCYKAGVASAMLGSLEELFVAPPGSLSGLMDVWEEDESGAAGPAMPPPAGSPPPASVLSCFHYHSTQCDVQHVDRGRGQATRSRFRSA